MSERFAESAGEMLRWLERRGIGSRPIPSWERPCEHCRGRSPEGEPMYSIGDLDDADDRLMLCQACWRAGVVRDEVTRDETVHVNAAPSVIGYSCRNGTINVEPSMLASIAVRIGQAVCCEVGNIKCAGMVVDRNIVRPERDLPHAASIRISRGGK